MTDDQPLDTPRGDPALGVFIPESRAAVCSDCGGVFVLDAGACSGCGSKHWSLFRRAPVPVVLPELPTIPELPELPELPERQMSEAQLVLVEHAEKWSMDERIKDAAAAVRKEYA